MEVQHLVDQHFGLATSQTLLAAVESAYKYHAQASDAFADPRLGRVPAGHMRNRQVDNHLYVGLAGKIQGVTAEIHTIDRSPNILLTLKYGPFLLTPAARPKAPKHRRLPMGSKSRLRLARESAIVPQQQHLLPTQSPAIPPTESYIFGVLSHYPDQRSKSKLGGLDLIIVDQAYHVVGAYDLIARVKDLAQIETKPVVVTPVRIKRRDISG